MAFPPGDGDGRAVGDGGVSGMGSGGMGAGGMSAGDDETTVLPPVDGDPALVRPYVRVTGSEDPVDGEPVDGEPAPGTGPAVWAADAEPTTVLPPVPAAPPAPAAPPLAAASRRRAAPVPPRSDAAGQRRGKGLALAGGAVALVLIGTVAALITRPSGSPAIQAAAPSAEAPSTAAATSASASASTSPSASPSHSAKPSPKPSKRPSPTASASASPSASPSAPSSSPSAQSTSLSLGSTGPAVTTLQQDLRQVWIDRRSPTGVYDDRTAQDVTTFQSWYNVQGDPPGVYGPNSQAKMAQVLAGKGGSGGNGGGG